MALLRDDREVKMAVTEVANPDLAHEIKYGDRKHPPPKPSGWWRQFNSDLSDNWF